MLRRPTRSTRTAHSFPTRRSSGLGQGGSETQHRQLARSSQALGWPWRPANLGSGRALQFDLDPARLTPIEAGIFRAFRRPCSPARWTQSRSEEHTSELQSLMRISYAVFCLTQKTDNNTNTT